MKKLDVFISIFGMAIFAGVIVKVGPAVIAAELRHIWTGLGFLLVLSAVRLVLQTYSWSTALKANGNAPSARELVGIRLASQSLGYLSTFGPLLSEPLKIRMLGTSADSAASTLVDTGLYWFTSSLFGMIACVSAGLWAGRGGHAAWFILLAFVFLVGLALIARKGTVLAPVVHSLGRRSPGWLKKGEEIETQIRLFRLEHPRAVRRMFWIDTICQALVASEVAVMLWSLGEPVHISTVLGIEVCTRAVKAAAGWVPARIGADEGGAMGAFAAFGLSPASGFALAIARRTRDLLWCIAGLSWSLWKTYRSRTHQDSQIMEEVVMTIPELQPHLVSGSGDTIPMALSNRRLIRFREQSKC
jgi:uncharacterized membrane protein YbhN (UPF0104 family)